MLVSPTEPPELRALGTTSTQCESRGVDFLFPAYNLGPIGVQRKEVSDLLNSVYDGRLAREMAQMSCLRVRVLLIEGKLRWTTDDLLITNHQPARPWSRAQHDGLLWSAQLHGCWIAHTADLDDTIGWLRRFGRWCLKKGHGGLLSRTTPKPGQWGTRGSKEWGMHLLMGLEGVGPERAERIWETFGGVPLAWTVRADDLEQVEGIGPKTAGKLINAIGTVLD